MREKDDGLKKITFIGDIMCEKPLQIYAEKHGYSSFKKVFKNTKDFFEDSDYVIGNLETVFGGKECGYTRELYNFNTPDEFADALSQSGIDMVTTATNHSLDRGIDGLIRTISVLDERKIQHTGTYKAREDERVFIKQVGSVKIAVVNYTYGTNVHETKVILSKDQIFHLNLMKPQTYHLQTYVNQQKSSKMRKLLAAFLGGILNTEQKIKIKKHLHMSYNSVRIDHLDKNELDADYLEQIKKDIADAKTKADFVIACIHSGGQFNADPGEFTKYMVEKISQFGVEAIVANHPHVVQKYDWCGKTFVAYSLGNYSISPLSVYLLHDLKPEYSVALHLYLGSKSIKKVSFSILKIVEAEGLTVYPVDELYGQLSAEQKNDLEKDIQFIYYRFTGVHKADLKVQHEYVILNFCE